MRKEFVKYLDRAGTIIILTFVLVGYVLIRGQPLKNLQLQIPMVLMGIALSLVGEVMTPWIQQRFPDAKRKLSISYYIGVLGYLVLVLGGIWLTLDSMIGTTQKAHQIRL